MGSPFEGFADIDPLKVPLPHGTEVITRAHRDVAGKRVAQGAVGRVVGQQGDTFEVQLVGVGTVSFLRHELSPRKAGQLRFAVRRDRAWSALEPCIVLDAVVGSRAWGLSGEGSDTDRRGVFVLPFQWTTSLMQPPQELISTGGSSTYWEIHKALQQALRADPNTLELLFVEDVAAVDPMGEWILEVREALVSSQIYGSFGRYALAQLKKLRQSLRLAEHRSVVVRWLREAPTLTLDQVAERLARETAINAPRDKDAHLIAKQYIKQLYRSLYDQGLIAARDFAALVAFARERDLDLELPRELRPKNAYNLLRLIASAIGWLRTGEPRLKVTTEPLRSRLLAIKHGEVPLDEVLRAAEELMPELEQARNDTVLPKSPDYGRADALLRRIREEAARRWFAGDGGPFGRDAPPLPALEEP